MLCTLLLAATTPTLLAAIDFPSRVVLGEGVYAITQGSGRASLNDSLVAQLELSGWADIVSPEVLAFSILRDEPVVVRGAIADRFLALERGTATAMLSDGGYALAGNGLANRLGLATGDRVLLVGSLAPKFLELTLAGTFSTDTPANDEILVAPDAAREIAGIGAGTYHQIRVETDRPDALIAFLEATGASAHVFTPSRQLFDVNSGPLPQDDRLTNLLLRSGSGSVSPDRLSYAIAQVSNSVRVVVLGLLAVIVALVAVGIDSVHRRVLADARPVVRILKSKGATRGWILRRGASEAFLFAIAGCAIGLLAGTAIAIFAGLLDLIVIFGHGVRPELSITGMVLIIAAGVASSTVSTVLFLARHTRGRPWEADRDPIPQPIPLKEMLP